MCSVLGVVYLLLGWSILGSSAQRVVLSQTTVMAGEIHDILCQLEDYNTTGLTLLYRWCSMDMCIEPSTSNRYSINSVQVTDAHSIYRCNVSRMDTNEILGTVTGSLNVIIPNFSMRMTRTSDVVTSAASRDNYVGLNVTYTCQTRLLVGLNGVTATIIISYSNGSFLENTGDRVILTDIIERNDDFERSVEFRPISEGDMGVYQCTGTVLPTTPNSLVTNGNGSVDITLPPVFIPTIVVSVTPITHRLLNIPPYNIISLTCTASIYVRSIATPLNMVFEWEQVRNGSLNISIPPEAITNSNLYSATGTSVLSLVPTEHGWYNYTCRSYLDVRPANDVITNINTLTLLILGPSSPSPPVDLATPTETLFHDRATIQFRVPSLTYDPETYWIQYGTSESNLSLESSPVSSGVDINVIDILLSIVLEDLTTKTMYYYRVVVNNSVDVIMTPISTFNTTDLPPDPPLDLRATPDEDTPTTYTFIWTPPTTTNGDLVLYVLTCRTEGGVGLEREVTPPIITGVIDGLLYEVMYSCSVRARNTASFSIESNTIDIYILETVPGIVTCGGRWTTITPLPQGGGVRITVSWSSPVNENGIILRYVLQLVTYNGSELVMEVTVNASTTTYTFINLALRIGVPYNVSIVAENSAGRGSQLCHITDFSDQDTPPPVKGLTLTRSPVGTEIEVTWDVLSLIEARGFIIYSISFSSVQRRRRQDLEGCFQSPCMVAMKMGGVTIMGVDPGSDYLVSVVSLNGENESGDDVMNTVGGVSSFPILPVVIGVVAGSLVIIISIVLICICIMCCKHRGKGDGYGVKPTTLSNVELDEKPRNYVNDTDLSRDQPPLYATVLVAERLRLIPMAQFKYHVSDMHSNQDSKFEQEYESLGSERLASCDIAKMNKLKNRFANIFPYDFSRVKLECVDGVEGSDYVNASYIDGHKQANAYIAAQGPMTNTIGDFWRMIWEHKLTAVIMLTKVNEGGKKKCEQYWPESVGKSQLQPDTTLEVKFKELMPFADYEIRKFEIHDVSDENGEVPFLVTHYHFLGWPDHGVPKYATSLIDFIRRVRNSCVSSGRPILVHCSAGVGRTGTYITLDAMLERMKEDDSINVYQFVRNMRAKRIHMVQTPVQYMFIHDALDELITCGDTAIRAPELRTTLHTLTLVNPNTATTLFDKQFELLREVSRIPSDSDCSDALQHYNQNKNRYQENTRIPYNTNRVRLRPTGTQGSEYINASFIDGYKHRNAYIATQVPLDTTVNEFWRMIWEFKSRVIVMVCQTGEEMSYDYLPEKITSSITVGKLLVTLISEKEMKDYIERKIEIKEDMAEGTPGQGFIVTQYHYQQWMEQDRPPSSTSLLQMIKSLNNTQRNTGNKPITVLCNDGIGRTGSFICIHAMLERVNTENVVDIFQFIKSSRIHRPSLVMELEHYRFCHDTLADYLESLDSYANFKDLS